jgi:tetratricopeptide (TPR) repeat protein
MDDLHWADASSIELLEALLRLVEEERLLLLVAARPGWPETSGRILELSREKHAERNRELPLTPLGPEAVRRMVRNLFPGGNLPYATRTLIEERAHGNPFYIEEVVRALVDQGAVEYRDGAFHATRAIGSAEIPGSVQEVVMARVDRLDPERKSVLQAAAVVGGTFHAAVLETMGAGDGALPERLAELCDAEFLVPTDRTRGEEFAFKHPLLQEVTYDLLLEARREALHRAAGEAIEQRLLGTAPGVDAMLAYHFGRGRVPEKAEEYLFRAGDEAARSAASSEALHFFQEASALYFQLHGEGGDPAKAARLEANVGLALRNRGREPESVPHFDRALERLGVRGATSAFGTQLRFVRDLAAVLWRLYVPSRRRRREATEREREVIRVMFERALAQTTSDPTRFLFDSVATLRRIVQVDARSIPSAGRNYAGAVGIFSYGGISFGIGGRFLDRAVLLLEGSNTPDYLYYRTVAFLRHFLAGDWSGQHELPEADFDAHVRAGRLWEAAIYLSMLAHKRSCCGDFEGARRVVQRLFEIGDSLGYQDARLGAMAEQAFLHLQQGRFEEAVAAADDYYEESPQDMLHVLALGIRAKAQTRAGALEEAGATLSRCDAILEPMGLGQAIPFHVSFQRSARLAFELAVLEAKGGAPDAKRLRRCVRLALANARQVAEARPEVYRLAGREAWLRGARRKALAWWDRSLAEAERLGTRLEQARTLQELGLRLGAADDAPGGRTGADCLRAARSLYAELHLDAEARRWGAGSPP